MEHFNQTFFLLLNAGPSPSPVVLYGAIFLAKWVVYLLPALLLSMWLWGFSYHRELAVKAVLAICLGLLLSQMLRWAWPHPRPFVLELGVAHLAHAPDASFPSNHAVFCFAMAFAVWWNVLRKRMGWVLFGIGLLVCWARVYVGVHFPLDMLGGVLVAMVAAWSVTHLLRINRLGDRWVVKLERLHRRLLAKPIARGWVAE